MNFMSNVLILRGVYFSFWGAVAFILYHYGMWEGWVGWARGWNKLYVPAMMPPFADMRGVQAALHAVDLGLNPQIENPTDVLQRPLNYPSVWIYIARALLLDNEKIYLFFCSMVAIIYVLLCSRIFVRSKSIAIFPIFFSGATLLALERGNNDLIIFSLLYIACSSALTVGAIIYIVAIGLKIYPVFGLFAFQQNKKLLIMIIFGALLILYFIWPEFWLIKAATPAAYFLSYGSPSISSLIAYKWGINVPSYFITIMLLLITLYFRYKKWILVDFSNYTDEASMRMFMMGANIYAGTFIFNSNFDYRLIFLILCLPCVMQLANKFLKLVLLVMIFLASNEWMLEQIIAGSFGYLICLLSKVGLFVVLFNILIDAYGSFFPKRYMPTFTHKLIWPVRIVL